jgi:hypothetical protein
MSATPSYPADPGESTITGQLTDDRFTSPSAWRSPDSHQRSGPAVINSGIRL